jgi:hypothetical protein
VVGEARRHRLRRREHVRVVAAAQRLGRVERRVLADRDERVLQSRALARVRVDVAGGDGRDVQPLGERGEAAVEHAVVALERPLQLDAERVAAERAQQPAHRRLVAHAVARAAAEADEALRVLLDVGQRHARRVDDRPALGRARVRVRLREQAAEVRPAPRVADQQGQVASGRPLASEVGGGAAGLGAAGAWGRVGGI